MVWTTTPWTLPGNVAVALDATKTYVACSGDVAGNIYYVNEFAAKRLRLKVEKTIKGEELVGLKYESPFDFLPRVKKSLGKYVHEVVASDTQILPVSEEEGTGLVHVAPGAGTEDFQLGKKLKFSVIELIDESATYISDLGEFSGKNAKEHPEIILDFLKKADSGKYLFEVSPYTHRYPACWRCKEELVWRVVDEWYIAMDPIREPLKKITRKINWIPKFGLKRELDWLENMHDWLISKKRYWGLALPIWECKDCGHFEVIGGKEELKEKAIEGWEKFEGNSPHRPWIDEVKIACPKCGKVMERIPDVGNPWLDAGIVSFSTISSDNKSEPLYKNNRGEWERWFPADFITESFPGQFKNWFYSLLAMSTVLENTEPFKTVLGFATLLGEDGRPMHKSWGNAIEFNEGADKIGVDVMRWMYVRQNPSENILFGYHVADETRRRFHLKLWNVYNFFVTYANVDGWSPKKTSSSKNILDVWILSRLNQTIKEVTASLEKYDAYEASGFLEGFVVDLSLWYVRRSRERVGPAAESEKDKNAFYETMYETLLALSRLLAPFTPFLSEIIYRNLAKEDSIHLSDWPEPNTKIIDTGLEFQMSLGRKVVEVGYSVRKEKGIPASQPLGLAWHTEPKERLINIDVLHHVLKELNIKGWIHEDNFDKFTKINGVVWKTIDGITVYLDTRITPELEEQGKTRKLIRQIQEERKKLGMELTQKIIVFNPWLPSNNKLVQRIRAKTLAAKLELGEFKISSS